MAKASYNFKRLIQRYSHGTAKVTLEGYFDDSGAYVPSGDSFTLEKGTFAVTPLSQNQLNFAEGGMYTDEDRTLRCYKHIPNGSSVEHTNRSGATTVYKVMSNKDYSDFEHTQGDGLYLYILRRSDKE